MNRYQVHFGTFSKVSGGVTGHCYFLRFPPHPVDVKTLAHWYKPNGFLLTTRALVCMA